MFFHRSDDNSGSAHVLPLLPLRDIIVFPHMVVPLFVGRDKSKRALDEGMRKDKLILLAAQKKATTNDPNPEDVFDVGIVGKIEQLLRFPDDTVKVLVKGLHRVRITRFVSTEDCFRCEVREIVEPLGRRDELGGLVRAVQTAFESYLKINKRVPPETLATVQGLEDPSRLADTVVVHLTTIKLKDRQEILETIDPIKRLERLLQLLNGEIEILQVERKIRTRVKKQMERSQKEYYLNEQMQAIQKELGEQDEFKAELREIEENIETRGLSEQAKDRCLRELKKLRTMQPMSAESSVIRNYLDWVLALPWNKLSDERADIEFAESVLDEDHFGLEKVKERVLEYLAVHVLVGKIQGPVLCLVGPPGVGKTSLARSIARAMGREFVRLSLGGVRDEAEIRGHRRTYIGALPGRLLQSLRRVGTNNPVFLLDEIDKMSSDFRGDPASALLEVLDPEQNSEFADHYLDLDYDLSNIMFVTTANTLSGIPIPLRDRMEIIELGGYTEYEKKNIAKQYLLPRQIEKAGLEKYSVTFTDEAVRRIMHEYTKESGVRDLERTLGRVCRKITLEVLKLGDEEASQADFAVTSENIGDYLGVPRFSAERKKNKHLVGLTTGLAYTSMGGTTLDCEVTIVKGKGKLVITGLLEKGMQESAQAAMSYIRSRQKTLGLTEDFYEENDVHIHFPEFVPKDGPSAGITMATSIASALLRIPVRKDVAMTGEITLRGRVLPIGGLKEKLLAAKRAGILTVLVPSENRKDFGDIPDLITEGLRIVLVEHMDQVLREALALSEPDSLFGQRPAPPEYHDGKWHESEPEREPHGVPAPTVDAPEAQQ